MNYLIDTSILIQAKNIEYRIQTFPCVWRWLEEANEIKILDAVVKEISARDDELNKWIKDLKISHPSKFLVSNDIQTQECYSEVANFVRDNYDEGEAVNKFLNPEKADALLIAKSMALNSESFQYCIINREASHFSPKNPKIPNICDHFKLAYKSIYDVLGDLQALFD